MSDADVAERQKPRTRQISDAYREIIHAVECRIVELGWTHERVDDAAGLESGYLGKLLHPSAPSGRQAGWFILDLLLSALWPKGYEVVIQEKQLENSAILALGQGAKKSARELAEAIVSRRNLRLRLAEEWGRYGGYARGRKLPAERRREIARQAARKRWSKPILTEITVEK
jgi:hypothetical protein